MAEEPHAPAIVEAADLERCLDLVRTEAAGPVEGVFGPGSVLWQVNREALVFLGAGRALLMQLAHPWVATAVAQHSAALTDPIGRFHRTFQIALTLVFGSLEQALDASRRLHRRHAAIAGSIPERLGRYEAGARYVANEISALTWVHATLVDTALAAYELVLAPLGAEARERYYGECRLLGALFGIPPASQPPDWPAFAASMQATLATDRLTVGTAAREIGTAVLKGAGRLPVPRWYREVTTLLMPERLREPFGLPMGDSERRRAARALSAIRRVYPALPDRLRHVGPYQEALARLSGRSRPDLLTRSLNRLWIGRASMEP